MDWLIQIGHFGEASQLLCEREHTEHIGAHLVLLIQKRLKWIKEFTPFLLTCPASFCSSSDHDSIYLSTHN
ncbi:hypothetical protein Bca4012_016471 [Brassica carinata]